MIPALGLKSIRDQQHIYAIKLRQRRSCNPFEPPALSGTRTRVSGMGVRPSNKEALASVATHSSVSGDQSEFYTQEDPVTQDSCVIVPSEELRILKNKRNLQL